MRIRFFYTEGFRISAIFAAIFMLSAAALTVSVLLIVDDAFQDQVVQFARADIAAVETGYRSDGMREAREIVTQRMSAPGASEFFLLQQNGVRLDGNLPAMAPRTGILTLPSPRGGMHAIEGVATFLAPDLYLFSGSDIFQARLVRRLILRTLIWVFAAAMAIAILAGMLVSRGFLSRTDAITRACGAIMAGNWKTRVPVRGTRDELDRLSESINAMLDRISALMENVRQVTNDIAHDLRTPLTHLRHRLETARLHAGTAAENDKALEAAIGAADDILAQFAALLRIAQIEGGARRAAFADVDLVDHLRHLREMFAPVAEDAHDGLALRAGGAAHIRGDRELLVQLFSNLIENAIVHTPPGTRIEIALLTTPDGAMVKISDNGPGVPQEEHAKLFQPLYRRETSRSRPGYGLGLALVSAIAELHNAKVSTGAGDNGGFSIQLLFPPASGNP